MEDDNPMDFEFLTKYKNKLDIGDCQLYVIRQPNRMYKELVISYKTIYINTYNVQLMDISGEVKQENENFLAPNTIFRHESF